VNKADATVNVHDSILVTRHYPDIVAAPSAQGSGASTGAALKRDLYTTGAGAAQVSKLVSAQGVTSSTRRRNKVIGAVEDSLKAGPGGGNNR